MARIIVFDVNETLLDIGALEPHFVRAFGDGLALREWFNTVLLYSEVVSLAGPYSDFGADEGVRATPTDDVDQPLDSKNVDHACAGLDVEAADQSKLIRASTSTRVTAARRGTRRAKRK